MTIIAWDGKTVAADRMVSTPAMKIGYPADKIHTLVKPMYHSADKKVTIYTAVACSGALHGISSFVTGLQDASICGRDVVGYLDDVMKYSPIKIPQWGFTAFLIGMENDNPIMVKVTIDGLIKQKPFSSFGSGSHFVNPNKAAFKNSIEMAVAACSIDASCGFSIDNYDPKKQQLVNIKTFSDSKRNALTKRLIENFQKQIAAINKPTVNGLLHIEDIEHA